MIIAQEAKNKLYYSFKVLSRSRKNKFLLLTLAFILAVNSLIIFNSPDLRPVMIDFTAVVTSAAAFFFSGITTFWKYFKKFEREGYIWLSIGLTLWFAAEIIWAYNRQIVGIEIPYPSIADAAWIVGYIFFAVYIYQIMDKLRKTDPIEKNLIVLVSLAVSLSLAYILNLTFGVAELLSASEDPLSPIVSLAYPILDGILLVPSMVIFWSLRKGDPTSLHWSMMSLAFILLTIGDIGFGYSFALAPAVAEEFEWTWALFYNAGYLCIAASMLWNFVATISRSNIIPIINKKRNETKDDSSTS